MNKEKCIVKSQEVFLQIKSTGQEVFLTSFFPKEMFRGKLWKSLVFESWRIFNSDTYFNFQLFLKSLDCSNFYITPKNIDEISFTQYINSLDEKGLHRADYGIVLNINSKTTFKEFDEIQKEFNYNFIDSLLFDPSGRWAFYTNPALDMMVLGYDPSIQKIVDTYYINDSERITSLSDANELIEDVEGVNVSNQLISNYGDAFLD